MILAYGRKIKEKTLNYFSNKIVSLVIDGSTSWGKNLYEIAIFMPGVIRHFGLFEIKKGSS